MATPKKGYWSGGERLPGVTTILGRFKDSGGLMHWAFKQGQSGALNLYDTAEKAADIGTLAHEMIESHINGIEPPRSLPEKELGWFLTEDERENQEDLERERQASYAKAVNAYDIYLTWEKQTKLKFLSKFQELQLICPKYLFGGTPDAIGEMDGVIVLLDWKTSNAVYPDYLMQLAAYKHLIEHGVRMDTGDPLDMKINGGLHLCRFSKDYPDFEHRYFQEAEIAWRQFKRYREAYDDDKILKARVK